MQSNRSGVWLTLGCFLLGGCTTYAPITRKSQLANPDMTGEIVVLTRDGTKYRFKNYLLKDSVLLGGGYIESDSMKDFSGNLALSDIAYIQKQQPSSSKTIIGVGAVTAFVIMAGVQLGESSQGTLSTNLAYHYPITYGGSGHGSCPYIYSWDGVSYHFESETFAGSVFRGAERSSFDVLSSLRAVDGVCRLRITNEREESEYTNRVALYAVDGPEEKRIVPDSRGSMHTIGKVASPVSCSDRDGHNLLPLISRADGVYWESSLRSKDVSLRENIRDTIFLEFTKPANASKVKLLVRGTNTELGAFAFHKLFSLRGPSLLDWYRTLESDPDESRRFISFMMREGMLHVNLRQGNAWVEKAAYADVGPMITKEQVVILDVNDDGGDILKVALVSTADLWRIDRIAMDYSEDQPVIVHELPVLSAVDQSGNDVAPLLSQVDNRYYSTVPGQSADLTFRDVPTVAGRTRTYIVSSRGFYHLWTAPGPADQRDLVQKILAEPGYGATLYLPTWKNLQTSDHQ